MCRLFVVIGLLAVAGCSSGKRGPADTDADTDFDVDIDGDADVVPDVAADEADEVDPGLSWTLDGDGVTVVVHADPFSLDVMDASGATVLEGLGAGAGDGYGAMAWTTGETSWASMLSPGYYDFDASLDPWCDDFVVTDATMSPSGMDLVLAPRDPATGEPDLDGVHAHVGVSLRRSTVRIDASVTDATPRAWAAAFSTTAGEAFMGFGERFTRTDQRGLDMYSWAEEGGMGQGEDAVPGPANPSPNGEAMTYYPVPFFISTRGYGFWLDSTWRNEFNLATDRDDAWRVWHIGTDLAFEVYLPLVADERPWPYHLIDLFTQATGRPMLPPAWTFGPRRRINHDDVQGAVSEIQAMRDLDLAITAADDAVHLLPRGSHVGRETVLAEWVSGAATLGYRVNCYVNPYLSTAADSNIRETYLDGLDRGYYIQGASGSPEEVFLVSGGLVSVNTVDFTNPDATAWYGTLLDWASAMGYSGFMYDFGEYVQPGSVSSTGLSGEQYHNLFLALYMKAVHDHMQAGPLANDWLAFARSGYTGASAHVPMVWSGDPNASFDPADGLPSMVRAGVNIGISGVPHWGGDINGFHCMIDGDEAADEELLVRWIQQGSMCSNMQDQDSCAGLTGGVKASIFDSAAAQEAWRTYARLHTRLFPYFYTLAHEATATGAPVMRHVFLENPDRPDLAGVDDAYYLGPALLVAPVVERGAVTRTVDLPAGHWLDFTDHEVVEGGATVVLDAPLAKLPLLLRDGHPIVLLDPTIDTLAQETSDEVVGPTDVAGVYDVVAFVSTDVGHASCALHDGDTFSFFWTGGFAPPAGYTPASSEADLASCALCYLVDDLGSGLVRVRITGPASDLTAGGLSVFTSSDRTLRLDLFLF